MKYLVWIFVVLILTGCSQKTIEPPKYMTYIAPPAVAEFDEQLLVECFTELPLPWSTVNLGAVRKARMAISIEEDYIRSQIRNGTLPAPTYVESSNRLAAYYGALRAALDYRVSEEGSISPVCKRLYQVESEAIILEINKQQASIQQGVADVNGDVDAGTLGKLKDIYTKLKPFLSMAKSGALGGLL